MRLVLDTRGGDVLGRRKFARKIASSQLTVDQLVDGYARLASVVRPVATPRIAPDPDDDVVVGTALAAMAELIVTGDKALLAVASHQGVRIVGVAQAIEDIEAMTPRATEKPGGGDAAS